MAIGTSAGIAQPEYTPLYQQFVDARQSGEEPILPDYSYAGYHDGEKAIPDVAGPILDITTFGAKPDDGVSDEPAFRRAIESAEQGGGGVIFFPPGRFLINTDSDAGEPIEIKGSNIVLRGSGYSKGGTIIEMVNHFEPADPAKMYSTPFMIQVKSPEPISQGKRLATVTEDARRETFSVTVDDASPFKVGDWVTLHLTSLDAVPLFLHPFEAEEKFTRVNTRGILVNERHTIAAIDGNKLIFGQPIHMNVEADHDWKISPYPVIEEFGVEDICFMGGWAESFIHHRSARDDGAWSFLRFDQVVNSWVRRCVFINFNYALSIRSSSYFSVLNTQIAGNRSHHGVHTREGYGVLHGYFLETQNNHHGASLGYRSVGTVYWRANTPPNQRIDSHSGLPIATLFDDSDGGILYGSGGPWAGLPHHLRYLTLWNYKHQANEPKHYDFWRPGEKDRFVMPIIVGIHGDPATFNEEHLQINESPGEPVRPASLYEAQLELRLGKLPAWINEVKAEAEVMKNATLPDYPIYE